LHVRFGPLTAWLVASVAHAVYERVPRGEEQRQVDVDERAAREQGSGSGKSVKAIDGRVFTDGGALGRDGRCPCTRHVFALLHRPAHPFVYGSA
jgi:hypothetical protein